MSSTDLWKLKFVETPEEFELWCAAKGYTKDDVAELLGVTRQTIYNWTHKQPYKLSSGLSDEAKKGLIAKEKAYAKIPRMLSFALLAIETMSPVSVFGGRRVRRRKLVS